MNTYAKTTDGKIHIVVSDDKTNETMMLLDYHMRNSIFGKRKDTEILSVKYLYSDILIIDTNLSIVKNFKIGE